MKTSKLFLLISFIVCVSSCKKDKEVVVPVSDFNALKNDVNWTAISTWASYSKKDKKFNVSGSKRDPKYYQEEWLGLNFTIQDLSIPASVSGFSSGWLYIIGGDVQTDSYLMDSTGDNQIHITSIDTIKKIISGTFAVRLVRDSHYSDKGEVFQFKEGQFTVAYTEIE
jgi:hypothetical protein